MGFWFSVFKYRVDYYVPCPFKLIIKFPLRTPYPSYKVAL